MVLHNDYGFQFLLSDDDQGIPKKKKNVGMFGEYAFIPHMGTALGPKDARVTKIGTNWEKR